MWKNTLEKTSSGFATTILLPNTDKKKHSLYSQGLDNKNISCERIFRCRGRCFYGEKEIMVNIMSRSITLWCIKHSHSALQNFLYIFTIIVVSLNIKANLFTPNLNIHRLDNNNNIRVWVVCTKEKKL